MSTSYSTVTIVGVLIPKSWLRETYTVTPKGCGHKFPEGASFCPTCGQRKPKPETKERLRSGIAETLGFEDANALDETLGRCEAIFKKGAVEVLYHSCSYWPENDVLTAGVEFHNEQEQRHAPFHKTVSVPPIPTQEEVESTLKEAGIPFTEGSYGLHVITYAN